jgi:hypothetical protein
MTIDAFDWLHRTTANPPNEPVAGDPCASKPARPFLYEGVFAHEYQHLLEYYEDPGELNWVNEGLSDWAQTLTGYVDPSKPITDTGFDSHIQCFLGWLGMETPANPNPRDGGPENSLTLWGDQGDGEILCDYGAAYTIMEFLAGRYGQAFMTELHRNDGHGFEGLDATLAARSVRRTTAQDVFDDWTVMVAIDGILDAGGKLRGGRERDFQTPTLHAVVNPNTEHAYSTPGAPPNGSDYVRLRNAAGRYLRGDQIQSLSFDGAGQLPTQPVEWTVDGTPPADTTDLHCPAEPASTLADSALYSGCGPNFDRAMVRQVTVPAADPTLTFETLYVTEPGWDFGFVQVSTDGGTTWTSLGNADTTSDHDPGAIPAVQENLPGFSGDSGGWLTTSFDLSAYSGQTILLSFRYITDSGVDEAGWWVDDVTVGGVAVSDGSSLAGWQSPSEVNPTEVHGYTVKLISYRVSRRGTVTMEELRLNSSFDYSTNKAKQLFDKQADVVGAIVTYNEPTESVNQYAPYRLTVNGVVQPGGGL